MKHLFKQPFFYTTLLSLIILGLIISNYVFGWTTPTQNPPAGNITLQSVTPGGSTGYIQFNNAGTFGGDANLFWDNTNKRLGIGTTAPLAKLHIPGTATEPRIILPDPTNPRYSGGIGTRQVVGTGQFLDFYVGDSGSNTANLGSAQLRMTIDPSGNVGIGTTAPQNKLSLESSSLYALGIGQVSGQANARHLLIGYDTTNNYASILAVEENVAYRPLVLQKDGGNVGIGTTAPGAKLDVAGVAQFQGNPIAGGSTYLRVGGSDSGNSTLMVFPNGTAANDSAFLQAVTSENNYDLRLYLQDDQDDSEKFSVWGGSCANGGCSQDTTNAIEQFHVTAAGNGYFRGNVGIGTTAPSEKLEVAGNVKLSGNTFRSYYDFTPSGAGLKWIRIPYNDQNSGGLPIHLFVTRSIWWNNNTPYGGPTLELRCQGKEWHSGQQFCTAQYGYHGDSGAEITHAAIRDNAANGFYIYLRLYGGVTYRIWQMADSGYIGAPEDSSDGAPSVSNAYALTTGFNIIGDASPNLYVAGNVGIGTTAPGYKLDVSGDVRLTGNLIATSNTLDNCAWTAWTCNASQTCPTGQVVAGVQRYTTGALCGTAPTQWYQMSLYCCNL